MAVQDLRLLWLFMCLYASGTSVSGSDCPQTTLTAHDSPKSFTSPGYPVRFPPSICQSWLIIPSDSNKTLVLETIDFKLPPDMTNVRVFIGGEYNITLYGTDRIFLPANNSVLFIEFRSYELLFTRGFEFNYYQATADTGCSREIEAEFADNFLYSPGYPNGYFNNLQCNYTVRSKYPGYRLRISVLKSDIEDSYQCQHDSLTLIDLINNGSSEYVVGTVCGDEQPSFHSSGSVFKLMFVTNHYKTNKGFRIRYHAIGDDQVFIRTRATRLDSYMISPGYPNNVVRNISKVWTIRSDEKTVELTTVDCDLPVDGPNCTDHKVEVLGEYPMPLNASEYTNASSQEFDEVFCGNSTPSFASDGNTWVILVSPNSDSRGLVMKYRLKEEPLESVKCGGSLVVTHNVQNQRSPGYPDASLQNQTCTWTLTASNETDIIVLYLMDLDIDMSFDSFKLYDGSVVEEGRLLENWQGQRAGEYVFSTGKSLTMVYTLDDSDNGRGVSFNYTSVNGGGVFSPTTPRLFPLEAKDTYSYVNSPGYMIYLSQATTVTLTFKADTYHQIRVEFLKSNVSGYVLPSGTCSQDSITVYDGSSTRAALLAGINTESFSVCGQQEPVYISSGTHLYLVYDTRHSGHKDQGFLLKYRQGSPSEFTKERMCGGTLLATKQHANFTSPRYPQHYDHNLSCRWKITPSDNTSYVRLVPTDIQIESSLNNKCDYDSISVFDAASTLLAKLCGDSGNAVQSSVPGEPLTVIFITDSSGYDKGFLMDYFETHEPPPCAAESVVSFTPYQYKTPGYDSDTIPANTSCTWRLYYEAASISIKLSIKSNYVMTEVSNDTCSSYYLDIFDGDSENSLRVARVCGRFDKSFIGSQRNMFVKLVTGNQPVRGGYIIKFELTSDNPCGDTFLTAYNSPSVLTSPYFPSSYPSDLECVWHIDGGYYDYHVVMEVVSMDVDDAEGCGEDYLIAYDSPSTSSPFDRWCGKTKPKYESTGQYMTIKFHSSSALSTPQTGFKIKYWNKYAPYKSDISSVNVGAIIGGIIGGFAFIALIFVAIFCITQKPCSPKPILRTTGPSYPQAMYQPGQGNINVYHQPQIGLQAHSNPTYAASSNNLTGNNSTLPDHTYQEITPNVSEQSEPSFTKL